MPAVTPTPWQIGEQKQSVSLPAFVRRQLVAELVELLGNEPVEDAAHDLRISREADLSC